MNKIASLITVGVLGAITLTACGGDDSAGGSTEAFCATLIELNAQDNAESFDFSKMVSGFEKMADAAPGEIKDDARNMANRMGELVKLIESGSEEGSEDINASLEKSADKVQAFAESNCDNLPDDMFS